MDLVLSLRRKIGIGRSGGREDAAQFPIGGHKPMKGRLMGLVLLLGAVTSGADFKLAKVIDIRDASSLAAEAVASHPVAVQAGAGQTTSVPGASLRCEVTIALDGTQYTAIYPESPHFRMTDFSAGDMIQARIEGKKLVLKGLKGKEMKAKIIRQEQAPAGSR
jgi:hypothetical protein